jgi:hypothetical protein
MAVYTVHQPPRRAARAAAEPERFVFVRDGFSFWAFLLGPLWMLRHRMWLVLVCYVAVCVILAVALQVVRASPSAGFGVAALLALLIGFEAGTLRRFALGRRGWSQVGVVAGDGLELAERRFFDAWVQSAAVPPPAAPAAPPAIRMPRGSSDVLGLFPEPGAPS